MALIVEFISELWKAGYEYSTINGVRSAISALHEPVDGVPVGQHPLVKRALAGVFNERPPKPKYSDTWDVGVVLAHLESLGANEVLSDKLLTQKLAMLLALTTACRASEIHALNVACMSDKGDVIDFVLPKLTKSRRVGQKPITISIYQFAENPILDVVECLRVYLLRTAAWRTTASRHQVLLGTVAPHKPVVTSTISGWLKQIMSAAGIDVERYQAHSTRSAASSKAKAMGLSVGEIMERANWKSARTFDRFYNRAGDGRKATFDVAVLR